MRLHRVVQCMFLILTLLPRAGFAGEADDELAKSPYFAYVDREYIFTIEVVKPGIALLNFVSLTDRQEKLQAKNIRMAMGNRQATVRLFHIETDRNQQPVTVTSIRLRPRSSFGFRLEGNFGEAREFHGVEINIEDVQLKLAPLSEFDFETLVRKINRLNLGSPDFRDDFRVLNIKLMGSRSPARN